MTLAYIRKTYDVPAKVGAPIEWTDHRGKKWTATIMNCSSDGARLKVKFDHNGKRSILHPTEGVRYLKNQTPKERVLESWPDARAVRMSTGDWKLLSCEHGTSKCRALAWGTTAGEAWRAAAGKW